MFNKHTKSWSTLSVFIEIQSKATMSCHCTPTKMDKIKKKVTNKNWWKNWNLICCCWKCKLAQHFGKQSRCTSID